MVSDREKTSLMRTLNCTLKFPDGDILTAKASAPSPRSEVPVDYAGALERFVDCYETANLPFLEFLLQARAMNLKAQCEIIAQGDYDLNGAINL